MAARARLKVNGLSAGYGAFLVLRDLQLGIQPGLTVVLGPNGAGKTTLLKSLLDFCAFDAGHVEIFGVASLAGVRSGRSSSSKSPLRS